MSSVCLFSVTLVYCDKTTVNKITRFILEAAAAKVLNVNRKRRYLVDQGLNLCWGGLRLGQTVVIARYILKHDATLLPDNQRL